MFEWYTGFDSLLEDGIAEACYWIGYKKSIKALGLDEDAVEEGNDILRVFVNHRASLYRHREELAEIKLDKAKADSKGDLKTAITLGNRERKLKEKVVIVVWKILEQRIPFDDWMAMEGVAERPRTKQKAGSDDDWE